jgi:RNA polymerase sigma-70 factor, ECF subfamily
MDEQNQQLERFEAERSQLQAMAYRMLGSLAEADDAVQEAWLHLSRADTSAVKNLGGWLTTVVARICLNMLRSREARHEVSLEASISEITARAEGGIDPEQEALLADSVGHALLVVLDTLSPAERLAFVLHDIFAIPFDEIAPMLGREVPATRQLASRARRRVRGAATPSSADLMQSREVVTAFLAASRAGDFETLLALLDPDVIFRHDLPATLPADALREASGATSVARQFAGHTQGARLVMVNGSVGLVVAPRGRLFLVATFTISDGKITEIHAISEPAALRQLHLSLLPD